MRKRIFSFILCLSLIFPAAALLTSCNEPEFEVNISLVGEVGQSYIKEVSISKGSISPAWDAFNTDILSYSGSVKASQRKGQTLAIKYNNGFNPSNVVMSELDSDVTKRAEVNGLDGCLYLDFKPTQNKDYIITLGVPDAIQPKATFAQIQNSVILDKAEKNVLNDVSIWAENTQSEELSFVKLSELTTAQGASKYRAPLSSDESSSYLKLKFNTPFSQEFLENFITLNEGKNSQKIQYQGFDQYENVYLFSAATANLAESNRKITFNFNNLNKDSSYDTFALANTFNNPVIAPHNWLDFEVLGAKAEGETEYSDDLTKHYGQEKTYKIALKKLSDVTTMVQDAIDFNKLEVCINETKITKTSVSMEQVNNEQTNVLTFTLDKAASPMAFGIHLQKEEALPFSISNFDVNESFAKVEFWADKQFSFKVSEDESLEYFGEFYAKQPMEDTYKTIYISQDRELSNPTVKASYDLTKSIYKSFLLEVATAGVVYRSTERLEILSVLNSTQPVELTLVSGEDSSIEVTCQVAEHSHELIITAKHTGENIPLEDVGMRITFIEAELAAFTVTFESEEFEIENLTAYYTESQDHIVNYKEIEFAGNTFNVEAIDKSPLYIGMDFNAITTDGEYSLMYEVSIFSGDEDLSDWGSLLYLVSSSSSHLTFEYQTGGLIKDVEGEYKQITKVVIKAVKVLIED